MSIDTIAASIYDQCVQYMPTQVPEKAIQGFMTSAAIHLIAGSSRNTALMVGAMAVASTIIEAVTRPIVRFAFPNNPIFAEWIQRLVPREIVLRLASPINPVSDQIPLSIVSLIANVILNGNFYKENVGMVEIL